MLDGGVNILFFIVLGWVVLGCGWGGVVRGESSSSSADGESELKKLLPGWRMGAVVLSDLLWFVAPDWVEKVNVAAVGWFVLTASLTWLEGQFGPRGH